MVLLPQLLLFSLISLSSTASLVSPMVLHFFDIGYGDAILIQLPEGHAVLVDAGKPQDGPRLVQAIEALGIHRLDGVFITHFHKDHAGGLGSILKAFLSEQPQAADEAQIVVPFLPDQVEPEVAAVVNVIKKRGVQIARRGDVFTPSSSVRIDVLHPAKLGGNQNEDSMALRIRHGEVIILLGADVGATAQGELLAQGTQSLKSDLIKIPHHANETFDPVFERFVQAVDPQIAVLTIGPNPYGAPDAEMMAMYARRVKQIYRTDRHGTLIVKSDGRTLQVETGRQ